MRLRPFRDELFTVGFDEFQAGVGDAEALPYATGIRIPTLGAVTLAQPVKPRYRILLVCADLNAGDHLVGIKQKLEIGVGIPLGGDAPNGALYPELRDVVTPDWHFTDGASTWTLTYQSHALTRRMAGPLDRPSFVAEDCDTCGLLYLPAATTIPLGDPLYVDLTTYAPPAMQGHRFLELRDIRYRWDADEFRQIDLPIERPTRIRFYVDVLQTDPTTRTTVVLPAPLNPGIVPEEAFLQGFPQAIYWRAAGALIIERRRPQ